MARPGVIFFDAGGTLLAVQPSVGHVYAEVAGEMGLSLDPLAVQEAFEKGFARVKARVLADSPVLFGFDPASAWMLWRQVLQETFLGLGGVPAQFDDLFDRLYEEFGTARRFALLDGALETLDALRSRGHRVGLISNWDHRLRKILAGLDLEPRLDPIVISSEVRLEKPDPAIFRAALWIAGGVAPEDALMVGDSPEVDVEAARQAGLHGVLLDASGWYRGPLPILRRLGDLPAWLDETFADHEPRPRTTTTE